MTQTVVTNDMAFFQGRTAGLQLRGIGTNPYLYNDPRGNAWEAGYKSGRDQREQSNQHATR